MRLLRADLNGPLARPLTELPALTYGPAAVLADLLPSMTGVDEAYIYGSWAARHSGEAGPPPRDVDVLVVGEADEDDLADAALAAERRLGREVNIHRVSAAAWRSPGDDPAGAYQLLYDAARKALAVVLENQGLRATSRGGHIAVRDAVAAQLDPPLGGVLRPFDRRRGPGRRSSPRCSPESVA